MPGSFVLASVGGIAIRVHTSAVFAFGLLFSLLAFVYFPSLLPGQQQTTYIAVAFISSLALYVSTIAHELARALMARSRQLTASQVTLVMFTGNSDVRRDTEQASDELAIALAGPGISLSLALVTGLARFLLPFTSMPLQLFLDAVLLLNLWLGLFNLLPILPLDGGRAIRALLWRSSGDHQNATRIASVFGRVVAGLIFTLGVLLVIGVFETRPGLNALFGYDLRVVGGALMVAAWFLNTGARNAYRQVALQARFRGVKVAELMNREPATVTPWTSLSEIVEQHFVQRGERAVAVARENNALMGLVAYADVRRVPRGDWEARAAGQIMTPLTDLVTVGPEDTVETAIRRMAERHFNQLPVLENGQLVGMITRVSVLRFVDMDRPRSRGRRR